MRPRVIPGFFFCLIFSTFETLFLEKKKMLNIKLLREQPEFVRERLAVKNFDASEIIEKVNNLDLKRRTCQTELDSLLAEQNGIAKEIGALMKEEKKVEAEVAKKRVSELKERSKTLETQLQSSITELNEQLVLLPNIPAYFGTSR